MNRDEARQLQNLLAYTFGGGQVYYVTSNDAMFRMAAPGSGSGDG